MAIGDCDGQDRRTTVDKSSQPHFLSTEAATPRRTQGDLFLGDNAQIPGAHPAFDPRNDVRRAGGLRQWRDTPRPKSGLDDHLLQKLDVAVICLTKSH